jgi:tRNA pseudouridine38-40 synthase
MPRFKITLEYLGTGLVGWQKQKQGSSVQGVLESAIYSFSGEEVQVVGAGRTDAGVHATGQVAHFDLKKEFEADAVQRAINHFCKPNLIGVIEAEEVREDFHARFTASMRHYSFRIINRRAPVIIELGRCWWLRNELDFIAMQEAAKYLEGYHDFTSFRSTNCQAKSPMRTINNIDLIKQGEEIFINISALSFLHHMVRNIAGSLVMVGLRRWQPQKIKEVLEAKDRTKAGAKAPAEGLYFTGVEY